MSPISFYNNPEFASNTRSRVFRFVIVFIAVLFIGRLGWLQIVKGSIYRQESQAQAIKMETVEPFRGNLYDRNGILIVHNEPAFTVAITFSDFRKDSAALPLLASILEIESDEMSYILSKYTKESPFKPVKIFKDIDFKKVAAIEEYNEKLPGVSIVIESKRLYSSKARLAHLLGYTREITREELEKLREQALKKIDTTKTEFVRSDIDELVYYRPGDIVGKQGIEKKYEEKLRGVKGIKYVAVNRGGVKVGSYNEGKNDSLVKNGNDLYLTLDIKLQEKAEELMKDKRGAIIAVDPSNGEILCFVSKPDYDLKNFSGKVPTELYADLRDDPGKPLFNRVLQTRYPPGSTWKMLVALAGLNEHVIDPSTTISCPGSFYFGNRPYECHGAHGTTAVQKAIQASCNVFFYKLALKIGFSKMYEYAKMFGFGDVTNVDLTDENRGFFPTSEWLTKKYGYGAITGRLVNYGIGQGEIGVTPIQMAAYVTALANKGTVYQPHIVRSIFDNIKNQSTVPEFKKKELPIEKKWFDLIQKGMYDVVNTPGGTAYAIKVPDIKICGKTGTAQNPHGKDHSWFICFAPLENPKIAVVCIVENAGFGSVVAAPIARDIILTKYHPETQQKTIVVNQTTEAVKTQDTTGYGD